MEMSEIIKNISLPKNNEQYKLLILLLGFYVFVKAWSTWPCSE